MPQIISYDFSYWLITKWTHQHFHSGSICFGIFGRKFDNIVEDRMIRNGIYEFRFISYKTDDVCQGYLELGAVLDVSENIRVSVFDSFC